MLWNLWQQVRQRHWTTHWTTCVTVQWLRRRSPALLAQHCPHLCSIVQTWLCTSAGIEVSVSVLASISFHSGFVKLIHLSLSLSYVHLAFLPYHSLNRAICFQSPTGSVSLVSVVSRIFTDQIPFPMPVSSAIHAHCSSSHFPGKPGLADCSFEIRGFLQARCFSWCQPHWASPLLHPLRLLKGKGRHSLLHQLSNASTPAVNRAKAV